MANLTLWEQIKELKSPKYKWVDLTHELSPETPHWFGFKPLQADLLFDYAEGTPEDMMAPMRCIQYSVASQYGTHTDVPRHFWGSGLFSLRYRSGGTASWKLSQVYSAASTWPQVYPAASHSAQVR